MSKPGFPGFCCCTACAAPPNLLLFYFPRGGDFLFLSNQDRNLGATQKLGHNEPPFALPGKCRAGIIALAVSLYKLTLL